MARGAPASTRSPAPPTLARWTVRDAADTYGVNAWGRKHFRINERGHLTVGAGDRRVDLKELADDLTRRGISMPILLRFSQLVEARIALLNGAFARAISEYGYGGDYRGVYPIKVNQSRKVVEAVTRYGRRFHFGLEAGSKPELLAAMALLDDPHALVICNGYKDAHYIETALLASKLRQRVVIVVEKPSELDLIRKVSLEMGIRPAIGIRLKLSARGNGKWEQSGGDHAKFGLSASQLLRAVEQTRRWEMLDCLRLVHFHLGSQIPSIRSIKDALREATRFFVELHRLGCRNLDLFDAGGGLGVDYDGSQTNFEASMNYSVQEYANDVVSAVQEACDEADVPHPTLVTESGRAVVAHHSILLVNVIGATETHHDLERISDPEELGDPQELSDPEEVGDPEDDEHELVEKLREVYTTVSRKNLREMYHDALEYKDQCLQLFNLGHLSLATRAQCERLFWASCRRIARLAAEGGRIPEELTKIDRLLCDTYFCNFSLFQSVPDAWAIDQLFPIMPIHRLDEAPSRPAVLADITCDSDGKVDQFIDLRDVRDTLPLHPLRSGEPYLLGIMLTGAYQEILGDLHNLFGDTHVVNVDIEEEGYCVDEVVLGDTVADVLRYVNYEPKDLIHALRRQVELAIRDKRMTAVESRELMTRYHDGLAAYTYLETVADGETANHGIG
ncbi:MAG: biosynthetic arginine decarboxylase [Myxococcota bacterium]